MSYNCLFTKTFFCSLKDTNSHVYLSFAHHHLVSYYFFVSQREHKLKEAERDNNTSSSREKPARVPSLKKKPSERPALPPRPSMTNPVLRRNSSGRKVDTSSVPSRVSVRSSIVRRNSSDKTNSPVVSRVASGLRRNSSSCSDTTTSPDKMSTSAPESPNLSSETSTAVYRPHYLRTAQRNAQESEEEGDTRRQADPASHPPKDVIPKPRTFPRRERASSPDTEMRGPPTSIPPDPPSEVNSVMLSSHNQSSEEKNLSPSTPPEDPQSSPSSSLSEPETIEEPIKDPTAKVNTCQLLFNYFQVVFHYLVYNLPASLDHKRSCQNGGYPGD